VLVGGGCADDGTAHFGKVVSKVPVHRMNDALERLVKMYDQQHLPTRTWARSSAACRRRRRPRR
jgi:hypothetical protein